MSTLRIITAHPSIIWSITCIMLFLGVRHVLQNFQVFQRRGFQF